MYRFIRKRTRWKLDFLGADASRACAGDGDWTKG